MLLTYFLNGFEIVPIDPIITGITYIIIIISIISHFRECRSQVTLRLYKREVLDSNVPSQTSLS